MTLVGSHTLRDALRVIVQYAFKQSEFPLILTLENHVDAAQQRVGSRHFRHRIATHKSLARRRRMASILDSRRVLHGIISLKQKLAKAAAQR